MGNSIDRVFKYIGFYAVGVFIAGKSVKAVRKKVEAGIVAIVLLALSFFLSCQTTAVEIAGNLVEIVPDAGGLHRQILNLSQIGNDIIVAHDKCTSFD